MSNDLISRESLLFEIRQQLAFQKEKAELTTIDADKMPHSLVATGIQLAIDIIDNAPTIEPFEPDYVGAERLAARQRGYAEGYHNGMEIGKTLNPKIKQGEWIIDGHHRRCNYCNEYTCTEDREGNSIPDNFCSYCGADMRGNK